MPESDEAALEEDILAIEEALVDLANGDRGVSFEDFDRDFRKRYNLPDAPSKRRVYRRPASSAQGAPPKNPLIDRSSG
jgi:hypothetical protein